jgi:hypothetical protein
MCGCRRVAGEVDEVARHNIIFFVSSSHILIFFIDMQQYIEVNAKKMMIGKIDFVYFSNTRHHMFHEINRSVSFLKAVAL